LWNVVKKRRGISRSEFKKYGTKWERQPKTIKCIMGEKKKGNVNLFLVKRRPSVLRNSPRDEVLSRGSKGRKREEPKLFQK